MHTQHQAVHIFLQAAKIDFYSIIKSSFHYFHLTCILNYIHVQYFHINLPKCAKLLLKLSLLPVKHSSIFSVKKDPYYSKLQLPQINHK